MQHIHHIRTFSRFPSLFPSRVDCWVYSPPRHASPVRLGAHRRNSMQAVHVLAADDHKMAWPAPPNDICVPYGYWLRDLRVESRERPAKAGRFPPRRSVVVLRSERSGPPSELILAIDISPARAPKSMQPRIHNRPIDVYYWFHAALWVGMSDSGVAERRHPPWLSRVVPIFYAVLVRAKKIRW